MIDSSYLADIYNELPSFNISFVVSIFSIVMYWILFGKANEGGWKILIPFYGDYTIFKIAKKEKLFWAQLLISILMTIGIWIVIGMAVSSLFASTESAGIVILCIVTALLVLLSCIAIFIINIKRCIALAKAFGQTTAFGIGILFLEPIFIAILALNKEIKYVSENTYS